MGTFLSIFLMVLLATLAWLGYNGRLTATFGKVKMPKFPGNTNWDQTKKMAVPFLGVLAIGLLLWTIAPGLILELGSELGWIVTVVALVAAAVLFYERKYPAGGAVVALFLVASVNHLWNWDEWSTLGTKTITSGVQVKPPSRASSILLPDPYKIKVGAEPVQIPVPEGRCLTFSPFSKLNQTFNGPRSDSEQVWLSTKSGETMMVTVTTRFPNHPKCP